MKSARSHKHNKTEELLVSLAESVGSTLGTIAAKAGAAQKALSKSDLTGRLEREGKKIVRRSKRLVSSVAKTKKGRHPRGTVKRAVGRRARAVVRKARATARHTEAKVRRAAVPVSKRIRTRSKR